MDSRPLGADQGSPLENLRKFRLTDELDSSPAGRLANQLDSEIQDFVAAWRDQEIPSLAQLPIARIWLSGGGALLGGLREWIQTSSDTEVKILSLNAPNVPQDETPLYIIALGLALQATDGKFATRLLPAEMLDSQRHRDNLPLLWAALAIFLIAILFAFTASYLRQSSRLSAIQSQAARLQECGEIIPQLESASTALRLQDERLRPLLVASHQTANLRQAFQALRQASQQDVFLFFLSDHLDSEADNDSFATAQSKTSNDQKRQKLPVLTAEANRQPSTAYFCQGFTPLVNRFEVVRAFTDRLKQDDFFAEVDSPPQKSFPDAEQAQQAWLKFLRQYGDKDFLDFNLVLPLANPTLTSLAGRRN